MNTNLPKSLVAFAILAFASSSALHAQLLYSTDFSSPLYSDGNLVGQDGWAATSGNTTLVQVSNAATNGVITLNQGPTGAQDVNRNVGSTIGLTDIWNATFDVTVSGNNTSVYFAHFLTGTTSFTARTFVAPLAGSDFTFGISSTNGSTADALFSTGFSFNTPYTLTLGYNRATGISSLTHSGTTIASTTSNLLDITSIAFRQAGGTSVQVIDNLSVTAIPEPGTVAMLAIGACFILWRLRARRVA